MIAKKREDAEKLSQASPSTLLDSAAQNMLAPP